jgi:tetratricopeptide (TPR) repeat protein
MLLAAPTSTWATTDPWLARATALERQGNWPDLLDWGRQWTQAEPGNATAWFVLGRAYGKTRRVAEAVAAYRRDLVIDPGDFYALNNLGNLYKDGGEYRAAMAAYRDATSIAPNYFPAWHNLGLAFMALKGLPGVTAALEKLGAVDPGLAYAWRLLIVEYSLTRDPAVAQKAVAVLRRLDEEQRRRMFEILFAGL